MSVQTYCITLSELLTVSEPQYSRDSNKNRVNRKEGSGDVWASSASLSPENGSQLGTTVSLLLYAWSPPEPPPLGSHSRALLGEAHLESLSLMGARHLCLPLAFPLASLSPTAATLPGSGPACHGGLSSIHPVMFL